MFGIIKGFTTFEYYSIVHQIFMHMKKVLFLGIALAFIGTVTYSPPCVAKDVGTPVFIAKKAQVYQAPAPVTVELTAYDVCDLAAADYLLITPVQSGPMAAYVAAKVSVPDVAVKAMGGPPRSSPGRSAYAAMWCNRFSKHRNSSNRLYHIDPGLRGC